MSTSISEIAQAAQLLRSGGVVAFPTETVYGLGADVFNTMAVAKVYELKGRPSNNPLIVHVSGPEMAAKCVAESAFDARAQLLARTFWPGPLSLVLPSASTVPDIVRGGARSRTVAVRCPDHPVALALLFALGSPLVGPSANRSGQISPTTSAHVRSAFADTDLLVLEGGPCRGGIESTVLDLSQTSPRILRPGLITPEQISRALGVDVAPALERSLIPGVSNLDPAAPLESPGLLDRHYAPSTPARLIDSGELALHLRALPHGQRAVIITSASSPDLAASSHVVVRMPSTPEGYAQQLYAALHAADAHRADVILIDCPPSTGQLWQAIHDRLRRAVAAG